MSRSVPDRLSDLRMLRATSRDAAVPRAVAEGMGLRRLRARLARLRAPAPPSLRARVLRELGSAERR